jgi:hypothetical protein
MIDVLFMAGGQEVSAEAAPHLTVLYLPTLILQVLCFWVATIILSFFIQMRFIERSFSPKWRVEHFGLLLSGLVPLVGVVGALMIQSGVVEGYGALSLFTFVGSSLLLAFVLVLASGLALLAHMESTMKD